MKERILSLKQNDDFIKNRMEVSLFGVILEEPLSMKSHVLNVQI